MARLIETDEGLVVRDDWSEGDIHSVAECMDIELTDGQVRDIMLDIVKAYDISVGINNEVVERVIQNRVGEDME
jgi:hypothetical protein